MIGDLYRTILNEETLEMETKDKISGVELVTQKKEFYGLVVRAGNLTMLSPIISIGETEILLSGSVLVSSNYGIYQEWRFVPQPAAAKEADEPHDAASIKARWG